MVAQGEAESLNWSALLKQYLAEALTRMKRPGPVLLAGVGVGIMVLAGATVLSILATQKDPAAELEIAWTSLREEQYSRARDIATRFISQNGRNVPLLSDATYVVGRSLCGEAASEWNDERRQGLYLVASRYLQESYNRGLPANREAEGVYYLALSTFMSGRETASLPFWKELGEIVEDLHDKEIELRIAQIHLKDSNLDAAIGLSSIDEYLGRDDVDAQERQAALMQRAKLLHRLRRWDEGDETLDQMVDADGDEPLVDSTWEALQNTSGSTPLPEISPEVVDRLLLRGRLRLGLANELDDEQRDLSPDEDPMLAEMYRNAKRIFGVVAARTSDVTMQKNVAQYYQAICLGRLGQLDQASVLLSELRRDKLTEPLGWAAGIEEARVHYHNQDLDSAADSLTAVLGQTSKHETMDSTWMSVEEMAAKISPIIQELLDNRRFKDAQAISKMMWPPLPRGDALMWQAKIEESWGQQQLDLADAQANEGIEESDATKAEGLRHLRSSGLAYYKLANLNRDKRQYVDYLWLAAENYLAGHDFDESIRIYELLLEENLPERRARLFVRCGEAYLSSGQKNDALELLELCIREHASDPDTYNARLLASRIYLAQNDIATAKQLLIDNLEQEALTPKSQEWRESLFALGRALFREAALLEAQSRSEGVDSDDPKRVERGLSQLEISHNAFRDTILRLGEAVQRYQGEVPTFEHRYLLAEAYRHSARWPAKKAETVTVTTTRYRLNDQARQYYSNALTVYDELLAELSREQDRRPLNTLEKRLLRNTYFARADMMFELSDYNGAIDAYSSAANQYNQQPESLEAFVRMASCYQRLNRFSDARGVLEQAKLFLQDRIPPDADFESTTRYSRDEWIAFLETLSTL